VNAMLQSELCAKSEQHIARWESLSPLTFFT
jgi:hypothetical protein